MCLALFLDNLGSVRKMMGRPRGTKQLERRGGGVEEDEPCEENVQKGDIFARGFLLKAARKPPIPHVCPPGNFPGESPLGEALPRDSRGS